VKKSSIVILADGKKLSVKGTGTVRVLIQGRMTSIADVLYVLGIGFNLLSIG